MFYQKCLCFEILGHETYEAEQQYAEGDQEEYTQSNEQLNIAPPPTLPPVEEKPLTPGLDFSQ